jgi:Family of unknown function (DUF5329)
MLTRRRFIPLFTAVAGCLGLAPSVHAALSAEEEINALINAIETSGCQFIRNGDNHTAAQAAEHLSLKYRKGKSYAPTAEAFIENLASKSSMTKTPYYLLTPQGEKIPSGDWLRQRLAQLRAPAATNSPATQ